MSRVEAGISGFLSISDIDLGVSVELEQGNQDSSFVEARNSACLSGCSWGVRPPSSCIWNLHHFMEDATGVSMPLVL